jgi:hypothetical protein
MQNRERLGLADGTSLKAQLTEVLGKFEHGALSQTHFGPPAEDRQKWARPIRVLHPLTRDATGVEGPKQLIGDDWRVVDWPISQNCRGYFGVCWSPG